VNAGLPAGRRAGLRGALLIGLVLLCSLGLGFLAHWLTRQPTNALRPIVAGSPASSPEAADEPPAPRAIPEQLPPIALPALSGKTHSLTEWRGKPLIVNFWATWCEPCRREIPLLKRLRHEHAADGLEVVGIAIDSAEEVRKYAAAQGMDYPLLVGEDGGLAAANALGMETVLPFSVFADREGRIVALKVGELHPDEASLILARLEDEDHGRLSLESARQAIAAGLQQAAAERVSTAQ
jgi:thiol-disulfide isomerase/thioredoxin